VTAHATRLARGVTDRRKIIKFQGHYHGWYDSLAMNHLTEPEKLGTNDPDTAGLLDEIVEETIVLPFNDEAAIRETFAEHGDEIAGVILEPIAHNLGCIPPRPGYLETLREVTDDYGSLLIFDEIITGFRHDLGGAQKLEGVTPDLTTMGKSVANGYPISILCGKAEYMDQLSPAGGPVAFGGTYNAHAGSLAAARETMTELDERNFHEEAKAYRDRICDALEDILEDNGITATVEKYGTVFLTYFMEDTPHEYTDVLEQNEELYMDYRWGMVDEGIMMVPKNVRRNYITAAHDDEDARLTIEAAQDVLSDLSQ
jgi:glutamate-1-semialdehyde 2,1-aminomutase